MLSHEYDAYNGIIIDTQSLPTAVDAFSKSLDKLLAHSKAQKKAFIWLTLPIELAHLVSVATEQGFTFHNCLANEITLIRKANATDFAPYAPTHSLGGGGLVQNAQGEILVIRERGATTYKLPGGHIELGEKVEEAVIREVLEETGIATQFQGVLALASTHPYRFGKSNIYVVCRLTPLSTEIAIQDTVEIEDAQWIMPDVFLNNVNNSMFNKYLVKSLLSKEGLVKTELDLRKISTKKHEVFIANA
ncbi:MAG: 8-oxo-dGTP pyrophosphatase MutT (NUDIX family) [Paraglaciecola sp.]